MTATGAPLPGNLYLNNPSWVTNSRTLVFGGYTHQVNVHDAGAAEDVHWFDDEDVIGPEYQPTDLGDGELTRQGDKLALVRSYGADTHIMWYTVNGDALSGAPPVEPTMACATGKLEGLHGPTWSSDGQALAWGEPDGVWIKRSALNCGVQPSLVIPGGSEPDWGPAAPGTGGGSATLTIARARLRQVASRGLKVSARCATACVVEGRVTMKGRRLAAKRATRGTPGTAVLRLKPGRAAAKRLARLRTAKLTVRVTITLADGAATTLTKEVRVRR